MNKYIITFTADGYPLAHTKPIEAENDQEAAAKFKDQFESLEGIPVTIIATDKIKT